MKELFKPLPSMVVAHYLGVPDEDRAQFDGWTEAIVAANAQGDTLQATGAVTELMGYFAGLIERRRTDPGDDTISHLVAGGMGADGDITGLLSILGFAFTMVTGGNDTTTGMLGGAVQLLTEHRDQRRDLIEHPELVGDAVEELLRLTAPVQGLARTVTRDVEIDGTVVPEGRKVLLLYGSANRDPRRFGPDSEVLDVRRSPKQILTFSHGAHHCLGAAAARMQARVALEELLARCPDFTVDIDAVVYADGNYVRRPTSVPFRVRWSMTADWMRDERPDLAAERILDVAAQLYVENGIAAVGMAEVARAAGCSRATLYRYFDSRQSLQLAFVHREARRIGALVAEEVSAVGDPKDVIVEAMLAAIRLVRADPTLAAWFQLGDSGLAAQIAALVGRHRVAGHRLPGAGGVLRRGDVPEGTVARPDHRLPAHRPGRRRHRRTHDARAVRRAGTRRARLRTRLTPATARTNGTLVRSDTTSVPFVRGVTVSAPRPRARRHRPRESSSGRTHRSARRRAACGAAGSSTGRCSRARSRRRSTRPHLALRTGTG